VRHNRGLAMQGSVPSLEVLQESTKGHATHLCGMRARGLVRALACSTAVHRPRPRVGQVGRPQRASIARLSTQVVPGIQ
jgi:hypothetical protein